MGAHIIGRPDDDALAILLGDGGADPERAIIDDRGQDTREGDGSEDRPDGDEPQGAQQ